MHLLKSSRKLKRSLVVPHWEFEAIGTHWTIDLFEPLAQSKANALLQEIKQRIAAFDTHYSRFRKDSLIAKMAVHAGKYHLPADAKPLLDLYQELYRLTGGKMTPLVGQVLSDAGYDASYSLQPKTLRPAPRWETILKYAFPYLELLQPALLDLGAAGKGYLVDIVVEILIKHEVHSFCVDAGGDIVHRSSETHFLEVGLEDPHNAAQAIGVAHVGDQSLCGSAGSRRRWDSFHHIIDPDKLVSPHHLLAVWVVAKNALLADALTTALFFVHPSRLAKQYKFEYALVHADRSLTHSPAFPATFFTAQEKDNA